MMTRSLFVVSLALAFSYATLFFIPSVSLPFGGEISGFDLLQGAFSNSKWGFWRILLAVSVLLSACSITAIVLALRRNANRIRFAAFSLALQAVAIGILAVILAGVVSQKYI